MVDSFITTAHFRITLNRVFLAHAGPV